MTRRTLPILTLASILGALPIGACTPHARYPAVEGDAATEDLNMLPSPLVMRLALERVAARHLGGVRDYDIMLPRGVEEDTSTAIAVKLGENVMVTHRVNGPQPVLRVARVWVLGDTALVDIERPVNLPESSARQLLTVRLRSDIRGWRIEGVRSWPVGLKLPPQAAEIETWPEGDSVEPAQPSDDGEVPELEMETAPIGSES